MFLSIVLLFTQINSLFLFKYHQFIMKFNKCKFKYCQFGFHRRNLFQGICLKYLQIRFSEQ